MKKYILTIDMGTTAFKSAVFDSRGQELGSSTVEYTLLAPYPGWAEMRAEDYISIFRQATSEAMEDAEISASEILTLGISCQCETSVFLDENERPLRNAIVWLDQRASKEANEIVANFGAATVQKNTGQVGEDAIWPGAKLIWLKNNEPEVFAKISKVVQLNGFIAYILTGRMVEEDSMLGSSIYWNINTRRYWPEMLNFIGIEESQLPEIVRPGSIVGNVTEKAAEDFGFSTEMTVNIGGTDLACGSIGTANIKPGDFSDSTGSSLCTMTMVDHPVLDPSRQMPCYCSALPGIYMIHAYAAGGMYIKWFRDLFGEIEMMKEADGGLNAFTQFDHYAAEIPAGSDGLIALPHLQGSGPPDLDAGAKACFYGMTLSHRKAHFVRAIMESVTMVLCRIIKSTETLGVEVDRITSLGGGALSSVWCQIKADATGREVVTTENNKSACCLGAAILAGVASGMWNSVEEACSLIKEEKVYTPNPENKIIYEELLNKYVKLMECLKPMFR